MLKEKKKKKKKKKRIDEVRQWGSYPYKLFNSSLLFQIRKQQPECNLASYKMSFPYNKK